MDGLEYYLDAFRNCLDFDGRARRSEYWYFVLFNFVASLLLAICVFLLPVVGLVTYMIYVFGVIIPHFSLIIRRLHDTNRSGWNMLFYLIPLAGTIIMLIFLVEEGTYGPNRYGPDPKMINEEDSYL